MRPHSIQTTSIVLLFSLLLAGCTHNQQGFKTPLNTSLSMKITSPVFEHNQPIPKKYTCEGENISPPLKIADVPEGTKTLVLIVDDPDAPSKVWVHWLAWNIDPTIQEIPENYTFEHEGTTDFETSGYGGPCPPSGTHHYFFKLYALDAPLDITPKSRKEELEEAMTGHVITKTELIGTYKKEK